MINVVLVAAHGSNPPTKVIPNYDHVFIQTWSLMDGVNIYHSSASGLRQALRVRKKSDFIDVVVMEPSQIENTGLNEALVQIAGTCQERGLPVLCWETDILNRWLCSTKITKSVLGVFDTCNAVLARHPAHVSIIESLTTTPAFIWHDVSSAVTEIGMKSFNYARCNILMPTTSTTLDNPRKGDAVNAIVLGTLRKRYPDFTYGTLSHCVAGGEIEKRSGIADITPKVGAQPHSQILNKLKRAKLLINLDFESVGGNWTVDAGACGTPTITTDFTTAGHLWGTSVKYPHDVDEAVELASELIDSKEKWTLASKEIQKNVQIRHANNVKEELLRILKAIS